MNKAANFQNAVNADTLTPFIGKDQLAVILELTHGEEGDFYAQKLAEYAERVSTAPRVYEQDGKGEEAIVYLYYFTGNMDWYITELDTDERFNPDGPLRKLSTEQIQAFGSADHGYGAELGYISIAEIIECGAEIDLYWKPKTLRAALDKTPPTPNVAANSSNSDKGGDAGQNRKDSEKDGSRRERSRGHAACGRRPERRFSAGVETL